MHFRPLLQRAPVSDGVEVGSLYAGAVILELKGSAEGLESQVRHTLVNINPNLTVVNYETFEEQINGRFNQDRLIARLTLMFSLLALVLASVGLYGVTAYTVARRTAEIGIRMALGAERGSVMAMVMRGAMIQAALGLAMGAPIALFCVRFVKTQLYEVAGANASVFVGAIVTLAAATCVAGLVPARRAASIDPQAALRHE
jgi:ABC-type antimicrobial peptide transport system permease subunit